MSYVKYRTDYTKEEVIELCRRRDEGDNEAVNLLVQSQIPWAMKMARQIARRKCEEAEAAAMEAVFEAVLKYDPRIAKLSSWVSRPVKWAVQKSLTFTGSTLSRGRGPNVKDMKDETREKFYAKRIEAVELEKIRDREHDEPSDEDRAAIAKMRRNIALLPHDLRIVIEGRMQGRTLRDIGEEVGRCRDAIRQRELRAKRLMREMASGVYANVLACQANTHCVVQKMQQLTLSLFGGNHDRNDLQTRRRSIVRAKRTAGNAAYKAHSRRAPMPGQLSLFEAAAWQPDMASDLGVGG